MDASRDYLAFKCSLCTAGYFQFPICFLISAQASSSQILLGCDEIIVKLEPKGSKSGLSIFIVFDLAF